jgi:hypothetical protein
MAAARRFICSLLTLATLAITGATLFSYAVYAPKWKGPRAQIHLQLEGPYRTLIDGSPSFNEVARKALNDWNRRIGELKLVPIVGSTAPIGDENGVSNVFFDSTVYGFDFGDAVAVTLTTRTRKGFTGEKDVIFNGLLEWDSYRGRLRMHNFDYTYDLLRVALHEFGHVLGLDHPDEVGQRVTAIMNAYVSNIDALQTDDINGAISLYGPAAPKPIAGALTVKLLSPKVAPVVVSGNSIKITGRSNPSAITKLSVLNKDRQRTRTPAVGVAKWKARVPLEPGTNRLVVFAQEVGGTRAKPVATLTVIRN